jgi:N-acetylneuraminate synthase
MKVQFGKRTIGMAEPVFVIAEISANHNGSLDRALATIDAAAEAGADCVKLQTYRADTLTLDSDQSDFVVHSPGPWQGRRLYDLYEEAHTPWEWHPQLFERARAHGLECFSTPFDHTAVDLLEGLKVPAFKIASFELVDDALLARVARSGKPVVISTGMASLEEIAHALAALREAGARDIIVLRCTSSYPAADNDMNLRSIPFLRDFTGCLVGLSDHSLGSAAPVAAVALGACMIEKHITLSRKDGGVDSHFSLEPSEFNCMVRDVRRAQEMLGEARFGSGIEGEKASREFRRSLFAVKDIAAGEQFTADNVKSIRPGSGLSPKYLSVVMGRRARFDLLRGTPLSWDSLA